MRPHLAESLVPGLGHLRRGYVAAGVRWLIFAVVWVAIAVGLHEGVLGSVARLHVEDVVALVYFAVFPFALVFGAHRSLVRLVVPPPPEGRGTMALAMRSFQKNSRGVWGLALLTAIYTVAFLAPVLAPYDPESMPSDTAVNKNRRPFETVTVFGDTKRGEVYALSWKVDGDALVLYRGPDFPEKRVPIANLGEPRRGWSRGGRGLHTMTIAGQTVPFRRDYHLLGTDTNGRDLLSRIVYGSRISLTIGFAAVAVAATLGTLFGALAGFFGGFIDGLIMRVVDVLLAFPRLLLLILIMTTWQGAGIFTVVVVLGATGWMEVSRLVRAQFLQLKQLDFAVAAKSLGLARSRIIVRHLLPNALAPVIVSATLGVGGTILTEAALSFLSIGVKPPTPTWGNIVNDGSASLHDAWWIATLPGLAIVATVVCFNLVGDALRDALDPKLRV